MGYFPYIPGVSISALPPDYFPTALHRASSLHPISAPQTHRFFSTTLSPFGSQISLCFFFPMFMPLQSVFYPQKCVWSRSAVARPANFTLLNSYCTYSLPLLRNTLPSACVTSDFHLFFFLPPPEDAHLSLLGHSLFLCRAIKCSGY